ncbi:MAG: filamentous hemagglutinin N-terminal domain-containing protein, partial [Chlamydiota bacterium]
MKIGLRFFEAITLLAMGNIFANPEGFHVMSGEADISFPDSSTVQVTTGKCAVVHWDSFSIKKHEITRFNMPSKDSTVLNRVMGGEFSEIFGKLEANGQVFLINPKGVLVGESAIIDTAGFIASSFDLLDEYLLKFATEGGSPVINFGKIIAREGDVYLKGSSVSNFGSIDAMASQEKNGRIYLIAQQGDVISSGTISAPQGEVRVLGETIALIGDMSIDVSGNFNPGTIYIGGGLQGKDPNISNARYVYIDKEAKITANALHHGEGGTVVIWSDEGTSFLGLIEVQGGPLGGNGGFAEVSSKGHYLYEGFTNALAPCGLPGTLLMDPTNITIIDSAGSGTLMPGGACGANNFCGNGSASGSVSDSQIISALAGGNVIVDASQGAGISPGNITFNSTVNITWPNATKLTFHASRLITCPSGVVISSTTATSMDVLEMTADGIGSASFAGITFGGSITTNSGNILLTGTGGTLGVTDDGIVITGTGVITTGSGNVTMMGQGGVGSTSEGINFQVGSILTTSQGAINLTGVGGGILGDGLFVRGTITSTTSGNIIIQGTGSSNASAVGADGIIIFTSGLVRSLGSGSITLTGVVPGAGDFNTGVELQNGGSVVSSGTGTITFNGTAMMGIGRNEGIVIGGFPSVVSSVSGLITLNGTSHCMGDGSVGVICSGGAAVTTTSADIQITGLSDSGSNNCQGVIITGADGTNMNASTIRTSTGAITISGTVVGSGAQFAGVNISAVGAVLSTGLGANPISITGTAGPGSQCIGVQVTSISSSLPSSRISSSSANISITGNTTGSATTSISIDGGGLIDCAGILTVTADNNMQVIGGAGASLPSRVMFRTQDATFNLVGDLLVQGGSGMNSFAQIGGNLAAASGNFNFNSIGGSLTVLGGTNTGAYALIGHGNPATAGVTLSGAITFTSIGADVNITGSTGTNARAQIGHAATSGTISGDITVIALGAMNDITLTGGTVGANSQARIGHTGATTFGASNTLIEAGNDITFISNASVAAVENFSTMLASGNVTLVVDQDNTMPMIGMGAFNLGTNSLVNASGSELRIYTADPMLNSINAPLNGAVFVPSGFDTPNEQYNIWYPGGTYSPPPMENYKLYY